MCIFVLEWFALYTTYLWVGGCVGQLIASAVLDRASNAAAVGGMIVVPMSHTCLRLRVIARLQLIHAC
jgi:hypothetical protein